MPESAAGQGNQIRVLLVDDHPMVRDGLKMLLLTNPDMTFAGEADSGEEALRLCRNTAADIILMDLKMPGMGGVETIQRIHADFPHVQIIALTSFNEKGMIEQALAAGAISYILKNASSQELAAAIRAAYLGQTTISSAAARSLVQAQKETAAQSIDQLTTREKEVLSLMAAGLSNIEIGQRLSIQPATVNFHVGNILSKLDAANRTEAVAVAGRLGMLSD